MITTKGTTKKLSIKILHVFPSLVRILKKNSVNQRKNTDRLSKNAHVI